MSKLILDSLEIRRFRAFQHLTIPHLGRINLIVGKNNVGKSSLLDALQIYARRGSPTTIWRVLGTHDESIRNRSTRATDYEEALKTIKYLFYGRRELRDPMEPIVIGPLKSPKDSLKINVHWFSNVRNEEGLVLLQKPLFENDLNLAETSIPLFTIQLGSQREYNFPLEPGVNPRLYRQEVKEVNYFFVDSNGLNKREIGELWDNIALTSQEKEILNALRIIAPGVEDISVIGDPSPSRERMTIIKVDKIDEPLPIRSLGDGMQRMLGIVLALVNAQRGLLLIDEIENGLHYSVQLDLWRLIFGLAQRLNVQVFATSHSWDCIEAFQKAAQENKQEEGVLIRLENKKGTVLPIIFDEDKLAIATREQIEVR